MSILGIILLLIFGYAVISCICEGEKGAAFMGILIVIGSRFGGAYIGVRYYPEYLNIISIASFAIYILVTLWLLKRSGALFDKV